MEFGLCLPNYGGRASRDGVLEAAGLAERLGFSSIWATDHVIVPDEWDDPYGRTFEPLVTLAHLAAVTERVRLGTSILVLPQREPILVAKQVATLDALSDGRVILGIGVGWLEAEFGMLGASFRQRGRRASEYVHALKALWASPHPSFQGDHLSFHDTAFEPLPRQEGGPPIWIGGGSEAALRRAARLGDAWHPTRMSPRRLQPLVPMLKQLAGDRSVGVNPRVRVRFDRDDRPPEEREELAGDRQEMRETIQAYARLGVGSLILYFGDMEPEPFREAVEGFAGTVMAA